MELVNGYLGEQYTYKFWIATDDNQIREVFHEGISLESYPVYLNCYKATIRMKDELYAHLNYSAPNWKIKHPKILKENLLGELKAYEVVWEGDTSAKGITNIRCIARPMKEGDE